MSELLHSIGRDLRYALRGLQRRRAFTFASVLTLALGIGATTAIFSVVYSVLIKPLPYPNADELVRIRHPQTRVDVNFDSASSNMYLTYREENSTLASVLFSSRYVRYMFELAESKFTSTLVWGCLILTSSSAFG